MHDRDSQQAPTKTTSSKICKLQTPQRPASSFFSSSKHPLRFTLPPHSLHRFLLGLTSPRLASRYRTSPYLTAVPELYPVLTQTRQARNISVWCVLQTWDEARLATNFEYHLLFRHYRTIHSQIRHASIVLAVFVEPPILCNLPEPLPL
ncbi:hypothetical protein CPAR01_03750 [Colletotrichum paranaense]|uniref:Uncharacterized protein n=2 Tax=Colletotrichum acutatum species complex TaxID=2707335 RepID=A0ABQ9Q990_9PEZI|nr:uncharacterized protein CPAR01_03750 [Colletotrichum paranaense]KAK0380319.1 hypothetical protein CLIM01_02310 [Colletotrichum limetticola]KAK1543117.1 hypothetical protein CPAR01_03750 [Colletotrichum paranaense]